MRTGISNQGLTSSEVIRQWLMKFVVVVGKPASPALFDIWDEQLRDIAPDKLDFAFDRLMNTWRYPNLPVPGDVRAQLDQADVKGSELADEAAWQEFLSWVRQYVFPDTGVSRDAPHLLPAVEHAARAAGGIFYIERCSEGDLVWCRKSFLAALKNVRETGQVEHLLSNREARKILARLSSQAPQSEKRQLAPLAEIAKYKPRREEVRSLLEGVSKREPETYAAPSLQQLAATLQEQKERLQATLSRKGENK
jgi:hypothetical protein